MEPRSPSSAKRARAPGSPENAAARLSCKRCRARKVKCDGQWPSCVGCSKSGVNCIIADPTASRDYTQVEVRQMQERVRRLESLLETPSPQWSGLPPNPSSGGQRVSSPTKAAPDPRVAPQTGASLFRSMLDSMRKRSRASVRSLSVPPHGSLAFNLNHAPHLLPPREIALQCVREYFKEFHVEHPFLSQARVLDTFHQIYNTVPAGQAVSATASSSKTRKQGLFQLNMVLAIGSIRLFRTGKISLHPFGFFTAALQTKPPSGSHFGKIEDIENFLLIAYFGIYYNIGCSVWELCRLCMRICVELQLHCQPSNTASYSPAEEQRRRKVFWECYSLDRFASSTLGRPFAINDSMISVELPKPFDDESCDENAATSQNTECPPFQRPTDLRASNHLLRLAQITSEIHHLFQPRATAASSADAAHPPTRPSSWSSKPGEVYPILLTCHRRLKDWLDSAPRYASPDCVPQSAEYFELAYQKERLNLFRTAIDRFSNSMPSPPEVLLNSCVHAACRTISIFDSLRRRSLLTCTRPHTHHVFTTGLVLIFSIFVQIQMQGHRRTSSSEVDLGVWWTELDDSTETLTLSQSLEALATAGRVLSWFAEQMPDMDAHARFFGVLRRELGEIASSYRGGEPDLPSMAGHPRAQPEPGNQPALDDMILPAVYHGSLPPNQQSEPHESGTVTPHPEGPGLLADPRGSNTSLLTAPSSPNGLLAGVLQNNAGVNTGYADVPPSSWPFSNMPWMEGVESLLSGYEWEMIYSGLSPLENPADMNIVE